MKRLLIPAAAALLLAACTSMQNHVAGHSKNPYERPIFYTKYLDSGNPSDQRIAQLIDSLRTNPRSAPAHNELGELLARKGFPKDATIEFERAIDADRRFYPAWYNLGMMRAARGDIAGARRAFGRTVHYKPGHSAALFQLGLLEEQSHNTTAAVAYYAKALSINHTLLDPKVNPRVLDSHLMHLALLQAYPRQHTRESMVFQPAPSDYQPPAAAKAASPQPAADQIVTPAPPIPNPAQTPPPKP
jgi:tetratricopeptide (TPR) repeat protein